MRLLTSITIISPDRKPSKVLTEIYTINNSEVPDIGVCIIIIECSHYVSFLDNTGLLAGLPGSAIRSSRLLSLFSIDSNAQNYQYMVKQIKKMILAATMLLTTNGILAYDFQVGGIYYNITSNTVPYTVEVTYVNRNYHNFYIDTIIIPSSVTYNGNSYSVTRIGDYAFDYSSTLKSVTIPNSVTSIGNNAFRNCTRLTSVTIPNSVTSIGDGAFFQCIGITTVSLGNSVTNIGSGAFFLCVGLTSVTIPNSVTSIGAGAFLNCSGLCRTNYNGTIAQWCDIHFSDEYSNPIYLSHNLYIDDSLLTNLIIPNTVDTIKILAFIGDTTLNSVTIPNSVTIIGNQAFEGCTGLRRTNYIGSLAQWCDIFFEDWSSNPIYYSHNLYINNSLVTNLVIPNTVNSINDFVFCNDTAITSVTIPNSVTDILGAAFRGCCALTSVNIPDSVINIGYEAFMDCSRLSSVTIGNSIDTIPQYAFGNDSALTSITFRRQNTKIVSFAFQGVPSSIPVQVPCGTTLWYRNELRSFSNIVEYMPYSYSAVCQDTTMGHITTDSIPDCSNNVAWTVTATANRGYYFSHWSDGDSNAHRTLTLTHDTILTAYFSPNNYNVIVLSNDTTKGYVSGSGRFAHMTQDTIVATANYGYSFSNWSDGDTTNPRIITITQDTSFTAFYSLNYYNVAVSYSDTTQGSVSGNGKFAYMTQDTIVATANYGYSFSNWNDGDTTNPRVIIVTQDTNLIAYFSTNNYNVVITSDDTAKGSVYGCGYTAYLTQQTIRAVANNGYRFAVWNDGDTNAVRTITVTHDTTFTAYFTNDISQMCGNLRVMSEDTNRGSVQVSTQSTQMIITAMPEPGFTFSHWSDNITQNPRILTYDQISRIVADKSLNRVLVAYFSSSQSIAVVEYDNISISTANGHILLECVSNEHVYVSDVIGRVVYNATVNEKAEIAVRNRGVYFVKVGNRPARKVVVVR